LRIRNNKRPSARDSDRRERPFVVDPERLSGDAGDPWTAEPRIARFELDERCALPSTAQDDQLLPEQQKSSATQFESRKRLRDTREQEVSTCVCLEVKRRLALDARDQAMSIFVPSASIAKSRGLVLGRS
jgi:hypothetical protein